MIFAPGIRKLALTTHVSVSAGWIGAVAVFLALAVAGVGSSNPETVRAAYVAMSLSTWWVIVPLALAALLTGVVESIGTPWGLIRHYWVVSKLLLTLAATVLLLVHTQIIDRLATAATSPTLGSSDLRSIRLQLIGDASAAIFVLLVATVLSIYKPWGLTPYGIRQLNEAGLSRRPALSERAASWTRLGIVIAIGVALLIVLHLSGMTHGH